VVRAATRLLHCGFRRLALARALGLVRGLDYTFTVACSAVESTQSLGPLRPPSRRFARASACAFAFLLGTRLVNDRGLHHVLDVVLSR
jgi:hypothetical protein